jgi:hypothetical protein
MKSLQRFIEVTGISEDEAISALVAAISPPQIGPMKQNWNRQPQFGCSSPDTETIKQFFESSDYRCVHCGSQLRLGLDHINSNSTDHSPDNLQVLCFSCNRAKGKGKVKNSHHGRKITIAVIELFDELGRFPTNKEIQERAKVTRIGRSELISFLKKRLTDNKNIAQS